MDKYTLELQSREMTGRKVKRLRKQGIVPGVVYGQDIKPLHVQTDAKNFVKIYSMAGETSLVEVSVGSEKMPTIIHEVATDPVSDEIIHFDLYKVNLKEKITASIPLNFVGESEAVKNFGAILVRSLNEIEVEALPQDLPHQLDVNLSMLSTVDSLIHAKDIKLPKGVSLITEADMIVAGTQIQQEEVIDTTAPSVEDVEVIKKEKKEEEVIED